MYARLVIGDWWRWWWWQLIIRGSVVEPAMSLEKLRGPRFWLFSKQSSLYCAAPWPPAESDCYIKDCTRWSVKFFLRNFSSFNFRYSSQQKRLMLKVGWFVWRTEFSLEKRRTKRLLSFKHIISKTKTGQCEGQIFSRCAICSPAVKNGSSYAGFHKLISVANSHHKNKFCTTDNIWNSQFLSSYPWY